MEEQRGLGVDSQGGPVVDPTQNVLDLVNAAVARLNDLRDTDKDHYKEIATLRAEYDEKLRQKEAERIDAIRAVDVSNVQRAADVVATQAETLRKQVTDTATAFAVSLSAALQPILKDIADLRQVQYETAGGKAQTVETREVHTARTPWFGIAIASVIGLVGLLLSATAIIITLYLK